MLVSIRVRAFSLIAATWLLSACGDGGAEPSQLPDVAGLYQLLEQVGAVTCTPERPPAGGGTVILDAFTANEQVRVLQQGSQLTVIDPAFPNAPFLTGSIDLQGNIALGHIDDFQEQPRTGNRIFFVNLTSQQDLQRVDNGARLVGSGSYVNIFREGSATAPVFATCSRTSTIVITRTGG